MAPSASLLLLLLSLIAFCAADDVGFTFGQVTGYTLLASYNQSALYTATIPNSEYDYPIYLISVSGSRYEMGYAYGYLLAKQIQSNFDDLMHSIVGGYGPVYNAMIDFLDDFLNWQWRDYLSQQVPEEYLQELQGIHDGGTAAGVQDLDVIIEQGIVLANIPNDLNEFIELLEGELHPSALELKRLLKEHRLASGHHCSNFGVWGSRTAHGELFSMRNLDWNKDTGVSRYRLITVYHPQGAIVHATIGYSGLWGALTGISAEGITVGEASGGENEVTFLGFPWVLRLRYVMENARNLNEAKFLWMRTNNTAGFIHMIGSAKDVSGNSHAALALETMADYTAYFYDDDPREQDATYTNGDGSVVQIGFPLKEALYRTNNPFDPTAREHYDWGQSPDSWSMRRYLMAYDGFSYYESIGVRIDYEQAVNITSIMADKGQSHPYQCQDNTDGSNTISVVFQPINSLMWAAWENGTGDKWRPACCNQYLQFNMTQWW